MSWRRFCLVISGNLDLDTLELNGASTCEPNGIAEARVTLARPIAADVFLPNTGTRARSCLVDAVTGAAIAGGVIRGVLAGKRSARRRLLHINK